MFIRIGRLEAWIERYRSHLDKLPVVQRETNRIGRHSEVWWLGWKLEASWLAPDRAARGWLIEFHWLTLRSKPVPIAETKPTLTAPLIPEATPPFSGGAPCP